MTKPPLIGQFWFAHGALAVAVQAIAAVPLLLIGLAPSLAAGIGAAFVVVAIVSAL
jgi:hypothetical protein